MNFIHVADIHLGASPESERGFDVNRGKEIYDSFQRVITDCEEKKVDLLFIAGDLFHKQPLLRELKEVNYIFSKLTHTKVVLIAGNHDYIGPRSNYLNFQWNNCVTMLHSGEMDSVYFEELNTEVYGLSYLSREIFEAKYDDSYPGVEERINILLAHGGNENNIPINYKKVEQAGFDYVALGHFHKPQLISDRMAYVGSLEPLSKGEPLKHGYYYGEIQKEARKEGEGYESKLTLLFVPIACREYMTAEIEVTPEMLSTQIVDIAKEFIGEHGSENFYQFILTGKTEPSISLDLLDLYRLGLVTEVVNHTLPDYDFDSLYEENKDNLIGCYIRRIRESDAKENLVNKALYYGIEALLNTKER